MRNRGLENIMSSTDVENRFHVKLAPCPFCGSNYVGVYCGSLPHVTCVSCEADGPMTDRKHGQGEERLYRAALLWNGRVSISVKEGL